MRPLTIKEITDAIGGEIIRNGTAESITGVSTDTRTIQSGDLFIPLVGERFDGHQFIEAAASKGAGAIITQDRGIHIPQGPHVIYSANTLKALQDLSSWYLKSSGIPVVAVTGSTGKTTTKDMIYSVLSVKYNVLKTQGNFNNEIGLPLTLFRLEQGHEIAVLEMGMSGFGEIKRLVGIAPPRISVITNIGVSHIEKLGSRENILKAKMEIFTYFDDDCTAIVNGDNDLLHEAVKSLRFPAITFGTGPDADYRADDIGLSGEEGLRYKVHFEGETYNIELKVPGRHNVYNSLAAIAVGRRLGMDMEHIRQGLLQFKSEKMRLNIFTIGKDIKVVDDAYNSSPDSVYAALRVLKDMDGGRKIAILGDMLELGSFSPEAHRLVGKMAAENGIDILIARGSNSAWTAEGAIEAGMPSDCIHRMNENPDVAEWLSRNITGGDRILVKGSRGMHMEEIVSFLKDGGF